MQEMSVTHAATKKKSHIRGLILGFSNSIVVFAYAGTVYYGGHLTVTEGFSFIKVLK